MRAETILANHDERYMPREVVDALKETGALAGRNNGLHNDRRDRPFRPCARICRRARPDGRAVLGRAGRRHRAHDRRAQAAPIQLALIAVAFAALVNAHLTSDFSVLNVAEIRTWRCPRSTRSRAYGGTTKARCRLWVLILAIFGALVALFGRALPVKLRADALAVQGLISLAFLAFILLTSNPFERLAPAPSRGATSIRSCRTPASPSTPASYLGYVGFSIVYSFAAAALIEGRITPPGRASCGRSRWSPGAF